jgi:hypothetical protein
MFQIAQQGLGKLSTPYSSSYNLCSTVVGQRVIQSSLAGTAENIPNEEEVEALN